MIVRRSSARLPDPPKLPGEDVEDSLLVEVHEICDGGPVSALGHGEVSGVRVRDEVAQGVVVDRREAEEFGQESVGVRAARDVTPEGLFGGCFEAEGFEEERFEDVEAAVVVGVGADVEEAICSRVSLAP